MSVDSTMGCQEAATECDGAAMDIVVSDSPGPEKTDRDERTLMGNHGLMKGIETAVESSGFSMYFVVNSSLCLLLYA